MHPTASAFVTFGILILAVMMAWLFVGAQWFAAQQLGKPAMKALIVSMLAVGAWLAFTGSLAATGLLLRFDLRPPPIATLFALTIASGIALGFSPAGVRVAATVPLHWLVLAQAFRLPLELVMHEAAVEGTMPHAMSFSGYNFDILTGASALLVAFLLKRGGSVGLARAWNLFGILMLAGIAIISFMASPMVRAFGDDQVNIWVAYVPFVWLPTILVALAIYGHIVVWKQLSGSPNAR